VGAGELKQAGGVEKQQLQGRGVQCSPSTRDHSGSGKG